MFIFMLFSCSPKCPYPIDKDRGSRKVKCFVPVLELEMVELWFHSRPVELKTVRAEASLNYREGHESSRLKLIS